MRKTLIVAIAAAVLAATSLQAAAMPMRETVQGTDADEFAPAASEVYIAWMQGVKSGAVVYVRKASGGSRVRVSRNLTGWNGATGGIWGNSLVYQEYSHAEGISDIYRFDLKTHRRVRIGAPVSTGYWEYWPRFWDHLYLFGRLYPGDKGRMVLYDKDRGKTTFLDEVTGRAVLFPGQVNGDFLVWSVQTWDADEHTTSCNVFRHRVSTGATKRIDNPDQRCLFGPSVTADGTVFYGQSGMKCGLNSSIQMLPLGGSPKRVVDFPDGVDAYSTYAVDRKDGKIDLYYDKGKCGGTLDVMKVTVP